MNCAVYAKNLPRLCFVGPMIARHASHVTMQGEILSDLFQEAGYSVICVSTLRNRYGRFADIAATLIRRRHEIDIQCLQMFSGPSFVVEDIASRLGKRFGHRMIMHLHGGAMPEFMAKYPAWTRRVLRRADHLVAPSAYLADAVVPYGFKAQIIPNLIQLSDYPYRQRGEIQPRLFWMRTFHPIYNPTLAIRTLAQLMPEFPAATLVMGGQDKGLQSEVEALAKQCGVAHAVRFAGFLNKEGKQREGTTADIFLNTNDIDNMPVSVVEACAMGLPVVATNVGGISALLTHEETGLLVPQNDAEAMAAAVTRLLRDRALVEKLSANGRRLAEQSSWEGIRPVWESVFARLMTELDKGATII